MKAPLFLLALAASASLAYGQSYIANLSPLLDGGGARQGTGTVSITLSGTTLTLNGSYSGITSAMTGGHIHGPGAPGTNAPVIYDLIALGILSGTTSGTYNGSFGLIPNPVGYTTTAQQLVDLNAGRWYLNIHDSNFGSGEIRGQILLIPEPSTLSLVALATSAGAFTWWRRRRKL
jgi:hypothetical protein